MTFLAQEIRIKNMIDAEEDMMNLPNNKPDKIMIDTSKLDQTFDAENKKKKKTAKHGCAGFLIVLLIIAVVIFISLAFFYGYFLRSLPDVSNLRAKASQFETLRILDRKGNLLYEIVPPEAGRRDYVTLDEISPYVLASVIAVEDRDYYNHPGFDLRAIIRAVFQNAESGTTVSGASTITQQLTRNLLMSQSERTEKTITRKIREIILSVEITRRYSKDEILEIYLNENYYGNHAYGIEAASQTYFKKSAVSLDLAESAFLAGLPQAPGYYDIFNNRDAVLNRLKTVLMLTYNLSSEHGCIEIRSGRNCVKIDPLMVTNSIRKIENYQFTTSDFNIKYPHWVNYIYQMLETQYGAEALYRSGYTILTSLDPDIQDLSERILKEQINTISGVNVHNGAVVVLNPENGDILAMVGSPDFNDADHAGQVNMAVSLRQPGSAIKPLIYAAAFEKGWTPATLVWDVETDFSPTGKPEDLLYSPPYHPVNYDGQFHGPVLVRESLASSLNIPAVKALQFVNIYDDPSTAFEDGFIPFARRMHVNSLDKAGYGLSVALGGGEVTLLELTNAFAIFAENGKYIPSRGILRITDHQGQVIYEADDRPAEKVLNEEYAFQISSILSDDNARSLGFGRNSILNLSYPAAVKTGTTNDYRDNWTIGYNSKLVVGVWVGNADNSPMTGSTGITGAAPVWHDIMEQIAAKDAEIRTAQFVRPASMRDIMICEDTGAQVGSECSAQRWEVFADYQLPPVQNEGLIRTYYADTWSGKLVSAECISQAQLKDFLNVQEKEAQAWIKGTPAGRQWAERLHVEDLDFIPDGDILVPPCGYPVVEIISPAEGSVIYDEQAEIVAVVYANDGIYEYSVEFAPLSDPDNWWIIRNGMREPCYSPTRIADWYLSGLDSGDYQIRVRMIRENGLHFEKKVTVHVERIPNSPNVIEHDEFFGLDQGMPEVNEGTVVIDENGEMIYFAPVNN